MVRRTVQAGQVPLLSRVPSIDIANMVEYSTSLKFAQLDNDYATLSVYCQAYLKVQRLWPVVIAATPKAGTPDAAIWHEKSDEALGVIEMSMKP